MKKSKSSRRLDQLLVDRGLAPTVTLARAFIMAGQVHVVGCQDPKAGTVVAEDAVIDVATPMPWVSRGGLKLTGALDAFDLSGKIRGTWLDCGASTGGFTQVLLENGAERVYAVDVGYGQLDSRLRADPRVVVMDRFNIRKLTRDEVPESLDGVTLDLSFISSRLVLPVMAEFLKPASPVLLLFKPQFEAEPKDVGKGGVIRDELVRARILDDFCSWTVKAGWSVSRQIPSPIHGQAGNVEFLLLMYYCPGKAVSDAEVGARTASPLGLPPSPSL